MQILTISYRRQIHRSDGDIEEVEMTAALDTEKDTDIQFKMLKEEVEVALGIHPSQTDS